MGAYQYKAFLSYAHDDRRAARRLHRKLEGFRVPKHLIDTHGQYGNVPARLHPVFRDREDLSAHGNLGNRIEAALSNSENLIVLCSPAAAKSRWVNEEILAFKRVRGEERILAIILDGEPNANEFEGEIECFPEALRFQMDSEGALTDIPAEPIAADLRANGDGKRRGLLKVTAGLLGIELDELVQRENRRRAKRQTWATAASLALAAVMGGLTWAALDAREEAEERQAQAEGLIEFMIGDLRNKLEPVGRLEVLDVVGERALAYYAEQSPEEMTSDALGRRSRALHLIGEIDSSRGNYNNAKRTFESASAVTSELLAREPGNVQRIYDHAQSIYWLGYIDWEMGDLEDAEAAFRRYLREARRLTTLEPANATWQAELEYGYSNIGSLLYRQAKFEEAKEAFEEALFLSWERARNAPKDAGIQHDLAQSHAWLSDSVLRLNDFERAIQLRRMEIKIYQNALESDPRNMRTIEALVHARLTIGRNLLLTGRVRQAEKELAEAIKLSTRALENEPDSVGNIKNSIRTIATMARIQIQLRDLERAGDLIDRAVPLCETLKEVDDTDISWQVQQAMVDGISVRLKALGKERENALDDARLLLSRLEAIAATSPENSGIRRELMNSRLLVAELQTRDGLIEEAKRNWESLAEISSTDRLLVGPAHQAIEARALLGLGRPDEAERIIRNLKLTGFAHPEYLQTLDGNSVLQ